MQAILGSSAAQLAVELICFNQRLKYLLIKLAKGTSREQLEGFKTDTAGCLAAATKDNVVSVTVTTDCLTGIVHSEILDNDGFLRITFGLSGDSRVRAAYNNSVHHADQLQNPL